jgi:hypothetical protein
MARHRHDHGSVDFQRSRVSAAAVFLLAGLAVGLAAGWGARVYAADGPLDSLAGATRTSASTEPAQEFSGRDFGGLRFPLSASKGRVSFSGSRVYTWARESPFSGTTVRAMLLSGDVQVKLGLYEFSAARAVVLLEKVAEPDEDEKPAGAPAPGTPAGSAGDAANQASAPKAPEPVHPTPPSGTPARPATEEAAGTYQFFVYFDRVASPAAAVGVSVQANRLAVRAVVDVEGSITLTSDVFFTGEPSDPLVPEAERALAAALRKQEGVEAASLPEPTLAQRPNSLAVPSESRSYLPATADQLSARAAADLAGQEKNLQDVAFTGPIFAKDGVFTVSPGDVTLVSGDDENALIVSRGFVLQYSDTRSGRSLQLTAQRGVVYTEPSPIKDIGKLRAGDIRGIYLEGDVIASDGQYTLRGPKMYYDVRRNKAVVLDGVFWTYDRQQRLPLYVRAEAIRQKSSNEFTARHAKLATSAFFEPDFSIGATTVTITRRQVNPTPQGIIPTVRSWASDGTGSSASRGAPGGSGAAGPGGFAFGGDASGFGRGYELESDYSKAATAALVPSMVTENFIDASNITLNAEGVPFFYWPFYEGPIDQGLLRDVRVEDKTASGVAIKTRWNAYRLIGLQGTPITRADLLLDAYFSRGPGVGTSLAWAGPDAHGNAFLYGLFGDHGTDVLPTGERVTYNDQTRGLITVDHTIHIDDHWTFFGELAYQSDANFVTAFYQDMAETRREFTTQGYLQRLEDNTAFNASMKGSMNNFITNEYLLQSQGYYVEKLPEFSYIRQADPLLSNWFGDALTWTQEYRYSYMSMDFDRVMPQNRGFSDPVQSMRIFGIQPDQTIYNNLTSQGYLPQNVNRIDTRQEVDAKFDWGPVNFVPFGVARLTGYDHNFENFAPGQTERVRVWGATGGTINTQFGDPFHRRDQSRLEHAAHVRPERRGDREGLGVPRGREPDLADAARRAGELPQRRRVHARRKLCGFDGEHRRAIARRPVFRLSPGAFDLRQVRDPRFRVARHRGNDAHRWHGV